MSDIFKNVEPMVYNSKINVPYHWWAGETASRFYISLRDEGKILGTRCPQCKKVYIPPRKNCPECFVQNSEWVNVGASGELVSYTVVRKQLPALPKKAPVIYGLIKLDGADTSLLHMIDKVKPEELKIGIRMVARLKKERNGTIMDIEYFTPEKKG